MAAFEASPRLNQCVADEPVHHSESEVEAKTEDMPTILNWRSAVVLADKNKALGNQRSALPPADDAGIFEDVYVPSTETEKALGRKRSALVAETKTSRTAMLPYVGTGLSMSTEAETMDPEPSADSACSAGERPSSSSNNSAGRTWSLNKAKSTMQGMFSWGSNNSKEKDTRGLQ
eukprot:CAMPEP_0206491598 /NCGR_PEP_ID=MMETSP0324_2-20121206/45182_1 /ASSEMBLY_ACC=CAM_ASM_000836 /TAXON_ID=2866 /ORGANISM="Crypthecodinium cohnii, Strain Seligo" /LENGTH=174 /DNA_ID=CAMNT_0053973001 /DNA_START=61 /DNA_END=585 /DNA_ORIENTATION=-